MVDQLGLGKHFRFLGYREDVPRLLAASDLAVLPSFSEGLPRSLLEAMVTGLPVVASGLDGIAELVVHGVTGFLVRPGFPAEFAEAVVRLLKDPELSREMGLRGKQRVAKHFHQAKMVSATERLYEQLMAD
jgi:glycosyltransferase involved in cell wall biosynthesis